VLVLVDFFLNFFCYGLVLECFSFNCLLIMNE
jgi:hypothetical protein